ncbi:MAG: hypothetical protein ACOYLN_11775 [Blastocatellia bacterium]|jgi:hypothetical protein
MKMIKWLEKWNLSSLKISAGFLEMELQFRDEDKAAAWELYVELLTRITTQPLAEHEGDEETALKSIHAIFGLTREIIKENGRGCIEFTKIAIVVLNQVIRPFTARWHRLAIAGAFADPARCREFREELEALQQKLRDYTGLLADVAGVEDLTRLEMQS